jgi:hypothetical protein
MLMDFRKEANNGYAFVNLTSPEVAWWPWGHGGPPHTPMGFQGRRQDLMRRPWPKLHGVRGSPCQSLSNFTTDPHEGYMGRCLTFEYEAHRR